MYRCMIICLTFIAYTSAAAAPPWKKWTFCKKSEVKPNEPNECLKKAIQEVGTDLLSGNSYFGTPPLDPLHLVELSMKQSGDQSKPVAIDINLKNVDIIGFSSWDLREVKADWDNGNIQGFIKFKNNIQVNSDYKMDGKVLLLPINGQGKANITLEKLSTTLYITFKTVQKKNKKHFEVIDFKVDLQPTETKFKFTNLFNGNKGLGDNMNKFLNENSKEVMKDLNGPIGEALGAAFKQISARIFAKIPAETIVNEKQ